MKMNTMNPESHRADDRAAAIAELQATPVELRAADTVDAALAAARSGVDIPALRDAWGDEAADLAALAERLANPRAIAIPAPSPSFVQGLERRMAEAFDARPARVRRSWFRFSLGGRTELALVGGAALVLALAAFLLSPATGIAPYGTPTAVAATESATETATLATPEVQVTTAPDGSAGTRVAAGGMRGAEDRWSPFGAGPQSIAQPAAQRAPAPIERATRVPAGDARARASAVRFTDPSSTPHAAISGPGDTQAMNTHTASFSVQTVTSLPTAADLVPRARIEAPAWAYAMVAPSLRQPRQASDVVDLPAPLPSPATIEAGKRRLMALADRLRAERRGGSERGGMLGYRGSGFPMASA